MRHREQKCQDSPLIAERSTPGVIRFPLFLIFYPSAEWRQTTIWEAFWPEDLTAKSAVHRWNFADNLNMMTRQYWDGWPVRPSAYCMDTGRWRKPWPRVRQLWGNTGWLAILEVLEPTYSGVLPDPKKGADSGSGDYRQAMRGHHWIRLPEIYLFLNIRIAIFKLRKLS